MPPRRLQKELSAPRQSTRGACLDRWCCGRGPESSGTTNQHSVCPGMCSSRPHYTGQRQWLRNFIDQYAGSLAEVSQMTIFLPLDDALPWHAKCTTRPGAQKLGADRAQLVECVAAPGQRPTASKL